MWENFSPFTNEKQARRLKFVGAATASQPSPILAHQCCQPVSPASNRFRVMAAPKAVMPLQLAASRKIGSASSVRYGKKHEAAIARTEILSSLRRDAKASVPSSPNPSKVLDTLMYFFANRVLCQRCCQILRRPHFRTFSKLSSATGGKSRMFGFIASRLNRAKPCGQW